MILMNKKVLIVIGAVLLLLVGGYFYMNSRKTAVTPETAATNLKSLIAKGVAQSCTYTNEGMSASVYISGGKVREDFDVTVDDKVMKSHVIVMDNTIYSWSDGQTMGMKMSYDPNATAPPEAVSSDSSESFDANADMDYKCSAWVVDNSKFTLPSNVTFSAFTAPVVPAQDTSEGSSAQCSYCESLTGDDKTQCLTALKCN